MFGWLERRFGARADRPPLSERSAEATDHRLRPVLDARYLDLRAAMESGERERILALLASGFVSEDVRGRKTTASAMADAVLRLRIDRSQRHVETTLTAIHVTDDEATVRQRYEMSTRERSPQIPEVLWTESEDVWRNVEGTWLLARTATLEIEFVRRGRRHVRRRRADGS